MKNLKLKMKFYQHQCEGVVDRSVIPNMEAALDPWNSMMNSIGVESLDDDFTPEQHTIANAVALFCDPSYRFSSIPPILGAYFQKIPDSLESESIEVDISELLAMYKIDENEVIKTFDLVVLKTNQAASVGFENLEELQNAPTSKALH